MLHSAPLHMDEILKNEKGSINSHTRNITKTLCLWFQQSRKLILFEKKAISNSYENQEHNLYLEMHNCGLDKPCVVVKVIESLPLFYLQALLRSTTRSTRVTTQKEIDLDEN